MHVWMEYCNGGDLRNVSLMIQRRMRGEIMCEREFFHGNGI